MSGHIYNFYHPSSLGKLEIYINQEFRCFSNNPGSMTKIENVKRGDMITVKSKGIFSSRIIADYIIREIDLD
jgi:hypothetical protein